MRPTQTRSTTRRREKVPEPLRIVYDWEKERNKLNILSLAFVALFALVAVLFAISLIHGHI